MLLLLASLCGAAHGCLRIVLKQNVVFWKSPLLQLRAFEKRGRCRIDEENGVRIDLGSLTVCVRDLNFCGLNDRRHRPKGFKRCLNINVVYVFIVKRRVGVLQILNDGHVAGSHHRPGCSSSCRRRFRLVICRCRPRSSFVGRLQSGDCLRCLHLGVQPLKSVADTHGQSPGAHFSA